ncbi:glycosyltransferase family 4 protein [Peribacillus simplex]|uniref:glycosyltransferase family 4 protein n=1 Tax=Peribacillus simplex TaxID=1478 RepID=UPI001924B43F|nr:glycosyltransferase family 4 protein [Peribacillus simplex]MBD8589474.1 glycosyltransferase family 4 protein [Peribacillus simplex]
MEIKSICFLAGIYPTEQKPKAAVFYQKLVHQFAKMNIDCRVIYPVPINQGKQSYETERIEIVDDKHTVKVYQPKTVTLGAKKLGPWNTAYATACLYSYSARTVLKQLNWKPDVFYGHFISPAGVMAAKLSKDTGIPAFIAYGESEPWSIKTIGVERSKKLLNLINGFISVSSKNKRDLIELGIAEANRIKVFPNAINNKVFYKREKSEARKKMGWDDDKFIVAFVGHFNDRKGVMRLDKAISNIPEAYVAYAGDGELIPNSPNIIHNGNVAPDLMPWYLSAADIFVLPTLNEGSCNAIIEAMACGLPIISSNREFNFDILSNENALLINPESIIEIRSAIAKLMNSKELRNTLSTKSLETAKNLIIEERAYNIFNWLESKC